MYGQKAKFKINGFTNVTSSIKDGMIEAGPEFNKTSGDAATDKIITTIRPTVRMPLTSKSDNVLQLDRFTSTGRGIIAVQTTKVHEVDKGPITERTWSLQVEMGITDYKFYPTGKKNDERTQTEVSNAFEGKFMKYYTRGKQGAWQFAFNARVRYLYDWSASDAVGVVNPVNSNGVTFTTPMIIDGPSIKPVLSPAISLQIYPGWNSPTTFAPTVYYDFTGTGKDADGMYGNRDPFNNLQRVRFEAWTFFYPEVANMPNVKIGLSPFLSWKIQGTDNFRAVEMGAMLTVKFGASFKQIF
jgi:hypothetical protein